MSPFRLKEAHQTVVVLKFIPHTQRLSLYGE